MGETMNRISLTSSRFTNCIILPNIFIWQLPDESISSSEDVSEDNASEQIKEAEEPTDEELYLSNYDNVPIKGYLEFMELQKKY